MWAYVNAGPGGAGSVLTPLLRTIVPAAAKATAAMIPATASVARGRRRAGPGTKRVRRRKGLVLTAGASVVLGLRCIREGTETEPAHSVDLGADSVGPKRDFSPWTAGTWFAYGKLTTELRAVGGG